jgi:hypothetical protein
MDDLAQLHADATADLYLHRPDPAGWCVVCDEPYPCPQEWADIRAIMGVEARWRRVAVTRTREIQR